MEVATVMLSALTLMVPSSVCAMLGSEVMACSVRMLMNAQKIQPIVRMASASTIPGHSAVTVRWASCILTHTMSHTMSRHVLI